MKDIERQQALERLKDIKPGDTIYTILRHRSRSGMQRVIELVHCEVRNGKPELRFLGYNVALALGYGYDTKRKGVRVNECGMDIGFQVVYNLGRALFTEAQMPSGVSNYRGQNRPGHEGTQWPPTTENIATMSFSDTRNGSAGPDPGYALEHRWL